MSNEHLQLGQLWMILAFDKCVTFYIIRFVALKSVALDVSSGFKFWIFLSTDQSAPISLIVQDWRSDYVLCETDLIYLRKGL